MPTEANYWTSNQHKFLEWLALPSRERLPLTQELFAKELGVHESTLSKWKQLPGFEEERLRLIRARFSERAHEITGSFLDEAEKGNYQQQKTWLEMMGWYTPREIRQQEGQVTVIVTQQDINKLR